jgi:hypothetical protein
MTPKVTGLLLAGSFVFLAGCQSRTGLENTATTSPSPSTMTETTGSLEGESLMAAYQAGTPVNCTMTGPDGQTVTYMSKNKKAKSTTTLPEKPGVMSYMINDSQYMYVWTSDTKTGFKSQMPSEEDIKNTQAQVQAMQDQLPDFSDATVQEEYTDKGYSLKCDPGTISDAEFIPPTDIQFQDMSAMMQKAMESLPANLPSMPPMAE